MLLLFLILMIVACVALALFILIQNPKGGGLAGNIAGFNSQFMGVKQTNDVLEKGTWILATFIALLSIFSVVFIPHGTSSSTQDRNARPNTSNTAPVAPTPAEGSSVPMPGATPQQ